MIEDRWPIDSLTFDAAIAPDYIAGTPKRINASIEEKPWREVGSHIRSEIECVLRDGDVFEKRIAVFPLARVSACLYAGYVLTNRPNVQLFQFHRDERSWVWPSDSTVGSTPTVSWTGSKNPKHICLRTQCAGEARTFVIGAVGPNGGHSRYPIAGHPVAKASGAATSAWNSFSEWLRDSTRSLIT
jgi:SMODS-associated and fused to various effectors sensor domain